MTLIGFLKPLFLRTLNPRVTAGIADDISMHDFHEDDYCQIEFLPKENFGSSTALTNSINKCAPKSFADKNKGYCYDRRAVGIPTKEKKYPATEMAGYLKQNGFNEYGKVTAGDNMNFLVCKNTRAFRKRSIVICFDYRDDNLENIWLNHLPLREDHKIYREFLLKTATKYNFLLADWWYPVIVNIANSKDVDWYLSLDK